MSSVISYYDILQIQETAAPGVIKKAYRKMALLYHPDRNAGSPESEAQFKIINNAYSVLSDRKKRAEYDRFIKTSGSFGKNRQASGFYKKICAGKAVFLSVETIYNRVNILMWDLESLLRYTNNRSTYIEFDRMFDGKPLWFYFLKVLTFLDKWMFNPANFKDDRIVAENRGWVWISNYFFDIRKRTDELFRDMDNRDLLKVYGEYSVRKIDCIFEAERHTMHYLNCLPQLMKNEISSVPEFDYSRSFFDIKINSLEKF